MLSFHVLEQKYLVPTSPYARQILAHYFPEKKEKTILHKSPPSWIWPHPYNVLLHTHIDILNLISLKNVTWHLTFRYVTRWTLCRMVISTARDNCIISRDDFILHCEIKYRRTEYGSSLGICCQIWTRPNNYGTV